VRPLRIGIDARELLGNRTGVGRYLGELVRRWTARPDADRRQFILYAPAPVAREFAPGPVEHRTIGRGTGTWWEQTWLRRAVIEDNPDVFFAPAYTAPLGIGRPLAVTIHDLSFVAHPEWFRPREGMRRRWLTRRAADLAAVIFTDSEFSRQEIVGHFRIDPARIQVIPPGVNNPVKGSEVHNPGPSAFAPEDSEALQRDRDLDLRGTGGGVRAPSEKREPVVLYVGSIFNRRRLPDLIAAFARATGDMSAAQLIIVGDDRSWPPLDLREVAISAGVAPKVQLLSYVTDEALASLYASASVFAFLSEYEGFGLTPLEALAAGVPIVVLDTPVAREVYGDAACYVRRDDLQGTASALRELLASPDRAAAQLARAPAILARYSWDATADRTLEHIERIARR
jgi:glycosyltransferase involved in cell wall biosynthesis